MSQDLEVIKNDFQMIKAKVKDGFAEKLSEGDTSFLGACTKSRTSKDRTKQPYSHVLAKPRAFSLKNSYMTGILRSINTKTKDIKYKTVEEYVSSKIKQYIGKSQLEIIKELKGEIYTDKIPKNINKQISDILIGKDKELPDKDDLFKKTSFIIKNLPITPSNKPRERMSFRTLNLNEFKKSWDESEWKQYFEQTTLLILCYREPYNGSKKWRKNIRRS